MARTPSAHAILEWLRARLPADRAHRAECALAVSAWLIILAMMSCVLAPTLGHLNTVGSNDWDQMESHRYLVVKTIRRFHQFPFWNPYACGGYSNWGGFESGTTVVSPWLPFYLTMTLAHALRIEVWGSALLSAAGAWLLAGRFAASPAARALVVVVYSLSGRWTLQIATGHTWHLAYAWTPWALYFYDRALGADPTRGTPRRSDVVLCAGCLAAMVYSGGIYPLPHTVFAMALYGALVGAAEKSYRPPLLAAVSAALAFGLSAPKLLPVLEVMARFPRIVASPESIDVTALLAILTARDQDIGSQPAKVDAPWGWHEFGMYVGWPALVALLVGIVRARGTRESALKWVGLFFVVVGLGTFDPHAPWPLIHRLPVFQSQHVPSRWLYPGLLLLLTTTAAVFDRALLRATLRRPALEIWLMAIVAVVAVDVGVVAWRPMTHAFATKMPATSESTGPFRTEEHLPEELLYGVHQVPLTLTAEMANIGTIDCATFPGLNNFVRDARGRTPGLGAHGASDPEYRGEAFVAEGFGTAAIEKWTPNQVTVSIHGATAGEHVVLNQNWDGGWMANGARALNVEDRAGALLGAGDQTVIFQYCPRTFWPGVAFFVATAGGIGAAWAAHKMRASQQR